MDRDVRLKQFSNALFSCVYKEYNSTFELPVKMPVLHVDPEDFCSEEEKKAVLKLCLSFRAVFNEVFVKYFSQFQKSVKHFMTFLTSRCLKLCGEDLFLSLVIICAFIAELNLFCCVNGVYAFLSTAPRCLGAIFNRRLRREFYARGGWERLRLFCENFVQMNGRDSSEHVNGDAAPSQNSVQNILRLLEQNSSSEEETTTSDESSTDEMDDDSEESTVAEKTSDDSDDSESSESSVDSEDSENDEDSETESSEEEGEVPAPKPGAGVAVRTMESDEDETETSEDSDPSSMTEDDVSESDSDDSQTDTTVNPNQTNCIKPIMQENLSVEKKIL